MHSWIGTSGFQYKEWKGKFYPEGTSAAKMLGYYSSQFSSTEINYTFRSIPSEKTIQRWSAETPDDFRFSLKAPQRVTHFAKLKDCSEIMTIFNEAVSGLNKKRGPLLFQLPATFKKDAGLLREFLTSLPKKNSLSSAFEFRHESWFNDEVNEILADHDAALCIAESDEIETPQVATAKFGYLRLRREDYRKPDLNRWAKFVAAQASRWSEVFVYFKHEDTCVGPGFAETFADALRHG
ncbi:DUF72 domain-containing protein [Phragmitibacter flavus]|uniref:DUF72 domain-containing protein n=1 Tax=Phragmitibacter flavus TaxID=2576071 RepID=A0A5R8K969_9BACT|nr:DUF72 domain-containing protein [Phragmitibacter flavus]TLD68872.1 DUF72 domain-containing protein [Phragmitibacter flavus]